MTGHHYEIENCRSCTQSQCATGTQNSVTKMTISTKQYGKFVQSNAEAAEELIPVRKRAKGRKLAEDARVVVARTEVQKAFESYNVNISSEAQQQLQIKKEELQQASNEIQEEELDEMIKQVEDADARSKHGESWRLINSITSRKSAQRGIIKGNSREDRIKKWYDNFHNLFQKVPDIEQGDVDIQHDLQIDGKGKETTTRGKKSLDLTTYHLKCLNDATWMTSFSTLRTSY